MKAETENGGFVGWWNRTFGTNPKPAAAHAEVVQQIKDAGEKLTEQVVRLTVEAERLTETRVGIDSAKTALAEMVEGMRAAANAPPRKKSPSKTATVKSRKSKSSK